MARLANIFVLALLVGGSEALKSKAKPRAHVDTCLEANTHLFLGLNGENVQAQMPYVEEACDASKGCAMFKKSEISFHRNIHIPALSKLMQNPHIAKFDFEVCLPQTSCLEEELGTGAVIYAAQCRYNEDSGQRIKNHVPGSTKNDYLSQGCNCGMQQCIDACVDADTSETQTITCATYCQDQLTESTKTFMGNFMCEPPQKSKWIGFRQAAIKMAEAHNANTVDTRRYDMHQVKKDHRAYFYNCEAADQRPTKYIAKTFGLPNFVGDALHWAGVTNKY